MQGRRHVHSTQYTPFSARARRGFTLHSAILCARDYIQRTRGSRGAHVNLEANRVVDFSSDQDRLDGTRQSGMSKVYMSAV